MAGPPRTHCITSLPPGDSLQSHGTGAKPESPRGVSSPLCAPRTPRLTSSALLIRSVLGPRDLRPGPSSATNLLCDRRQVPCLTQAWASPLTKAQ